MPDMLLFGEDAGHAVVLGAFVERLAREREVEVQIDVRRARGGHGRKVRFVEVKGRVGVGEVVLTTNEYKSAERLKKDYWLYAFFDRGSKPEVRVVRDPAQLAWQGLAACYDGRTIPIGRREHPAGRPRRAKAMTTATEVMLKLQTLSEEQQRQVLAFIQKLPPAPRGAASGPLRHVCRVRHD